MKDNSPPVTPTWVDIDTNDKNTSKRQDKNSKGQVRGIQASSGRLH
jgi:hypothetical protein